MLSLQNAGKRFGPRILFEGANWLITAQEKTALVGANGTGKSTLMKVLAGLEQLDYGGMQLTRGMSIGYLPQEGLKLSGRSVFDECLSVFDSEAPAGKMETGKYRTPRRPGSATLDHARLRALPWPQPPNATPACKAASTPSTATPSTRK